MGTSSRSSSASRSRSPRGQTDRISHNIPEMFRTQPSNMAPGRGSSQSAGLMTGSSSQISSDDGGVVLTPHLQPSLQDLRSVATDIKETLTAALTAAITDLKIDIQLVAGRVQDIEKVTASHTSVLRRSCQVLDTHTLQLRDLNRHMEDLDNRGRRHNLRIHDLPESIDATHLRAEVTSLFNTIGETPHYANRHGTHTSRPEPTRQRFRSAS